ncbi:MAG: NPCBM/NEW2 domain-containing protein [Planctomycetota bacterium]
MTRQRTSACVAAVLFACVAGGLGRPAAAEWRVECIDAVLRADAIEIDDRQWRLVTPDGRLVVNEQDILVADRASSEPAPATDRFGRWGSATLRGGEVRFREFTASADRLTLSGVAGTDEPYTVSIDSLNDFLLPAIEIDATSAEKRATPLRETVAATGADVLLLVNRDDPLAEPITVEGRVESIDVDGVVFRFGDQSGVVRWSRLVGFGLSELAGAAPSLPPGVSDQSAPLVAIETTAGDRLVGDRLRTERDHFVLRGHGDEMRLPRDLVRSLDLRGRRVSYADGWRRLEQIWLDPASGDWLAPTRIDPLGRSWVATRCVFAVDRSLAGQPLTLEPSEATAPTVAWRRDASRGVALRGPCRVEFALPEDSRRLLATIGVDPAADGDALVRLLIDGDEAWSGQVTSGTAAHAIDLPTAGASRLQLMIDAGRRLDLGDRVHFMNLRVVR